MGELNAENQLTSDKMYYHGYHKVYGEGGRIVEEGQWEMGSRTGT